ncbi:hypothetical protein S83_004701, partial [Arachis hypogaea]
MVSAAARPGWFRGRVKVVPSGDCLVIVALSSSKPGRLPEKTLTLSSLIAPRLARRGGVDEPFAWESREFLRKLCIGKVGIMKFGSVMLGDKNISLLVVSQGWAKLGYCVLSSDCVCLSYFLAAGVFIVVILFLQVREQGQQKGEASSYLAELLQLEEQAKQEGLGHSIQLLLKPTCSMLGIWILAIPAISLTMSAGLLFGSVIGTIIVSISGTLNDKERVAAALENPLIFASYAKQ